MNGIVHYYQVLGVSRDADQSAVQSAYRKLALRWHPDKNGGSAESEARFKAINEAYSVLSRADERQRFDAALAAGNADAFRPSSQVDARTAAEMFMREMVRLASELTLQNVPWSRIAFELEARGCPASVAAQLARSVERQRQSAVRAAAGKALVQALLWCGLGVVVTIGSYAIAKPGGHYVVTTGLFLFGGFHLLRALYYLVTARAP